jgi:Sulfatase-modifying factor enzyme 1
VRLSRALTAGAVAVFAVTAVPQNSPVAQTLKAQNEVIFQQLITDRGLSEEQVAAVRKTFNQSSIIGQGNPAVTQHPVTPQACRLKLEKADVHYENPRFEKICGGKYLAPLYDPKTQQPEDAKVCIDQFEFPNIPCVYPVVWVTARQAAEVCWATGERIADAHEWEGACQGDLEPPDYPWELTRGVSADEGIRRMRAAHNKADAPDKRWSYGPEYRTGVCGTSSTKTPGCNGGDFKGCGSNTFPAGDFPDCHSPLGVYDINGNAAESMNLPLNPSQMSSRGSHELGYTELKGSWFIFDTIRAHEDWCRWRAPFWHGTRVMAENSHANYHLGFRCVKDLK